MKPMVLVYVYIILYVFMKSGKGSSILLYGKFLILKKLLAS